MASIVSGVRINVITIKLYTLPLGVIYNSKIHFTERLKKVRSSKKKYGEILTKESAIKRLQLEFDKKDN